MIDAIDYITMTDNNDKSRYSQHHIQTNNPIKKCNKMRSLLTTGLLLDH